jgi:hypothetical protein
MEVSGQLHAPAALPPGKDHLIPIGWVGPKTLHHEVNYFLALPTFKTLSYKKLHICHSRSSSVGMATGYELGFDSQRGLGIFLFSTASRPTLGSTQSPIQWVPGAFSQRVKRSGREADRSPPSSVEIKNAWRYTSSWCGAWLSTRTTVPLPYIYVTAFWATWPVHHNTNNSGKRK